MTRMAKMLVVWMAVIFVSLAVGASISSPAFAEYEEPQGTESTSGICSEIARDGQKGALLAVIVPCMLFTIEDATITFAELTVQWLEPLLYVFLTLVITLFGVKVLQQEPEIHKQGFILLIKIAVVAIVLADLGSIRSFSGEAGKSELIPAVYDIMNESQSVIIAGLDVSSFKCTFEADAPAGLWDMFDCIAGKIFGFTTGADGGRNMLLVTSLFGLLAGFFFGGPWGMIIFFGMLGVIVSIFVMMIRVVLAFVNSYLIVCVLIILTPLLLPLSFMKVTTQYYDKVIRNILACFLVPIVFSAFATFALLIYDRMLFADDSILQKLFDYEQIKPALEPSKKPCDRQVTGNPVDTRLGTNEPGATDMTELFMNPFLRNSVIPTLSGGNNACAIAKVPVFNLDKVASEEFKKSGKELFDKLFMELMTLFILAYLVNKATEGLPDLVGRISAGGSAVFAAIRDSEGSIDNRFMAASKAGVEAASRTFTEGGRELSGMDAVRRMPQATNSGIDSFYSVLKGKK